jgi:hypothetical protein
MANWASIGHGLRRRTGAPSNHLESAGKGVTRNHPTSDEALEAAAAANSARVPVGAAPALQGTLVPRKNTQSADPTAGGKANRANIERVGATYRVTANIGVSVDPAAGPTMANARIVPSIQGRVNPNFDSGIQSVQ